MRATFGGVSLADDQVQVIERGAGHDVAAVELSHPPLGVILTIRRGSVRERLALRVGSVLDRRRDWRTGRARLGRGVHRPAAVRQAAGHRIGRDLPSSQSCSFPGRDADPRNGPTGLPGCRSSEDDARRVTTPYGELVGVEAVRSWQHPELGLLSISGACGWWSRPGWCTWWVGGCCAPQPSRADGCVLPSCR